MYNLLIALLILISGSTSCGVDRELVNIEADTLNSYGLNLIKILNDIKKEDKTNVSSIELPIPKVKTRPEITNIPLEDNLLDYIWNKSINNGLPYELLLAIAKVESNFNVNTESHTNDSGLFQIHSRTGKWIAKELGINKYDLSDPYTSTDFAVYYLIFLQETWKGKGLSEEDLFNAIIISYNRGVSGASKYIKKNGTKNNGYLKKINKYRVLFEEYI